MKPRECGIRGNEIVTSSRSRAPRSIRVHLATRSPRPSSAPAEVTGHRREVVKYLDLWES